MSLTPLTLQLYLLLGVAAFVWLARRAWHRRARIGPGLEYVAVFGPITMFLPLVLAQFASGRWQDATWPMVMIGFCLTLLLGGTDAWSIYGVRDDQIQHLLEKALAVEQLTPMRTLTGLEFDNGAVLKIHSQVIWGEPICRLVWEPTGASRDFGDLKHRLNDYLASVLFPRRRLATVFYTTLASLCLLGAVLVWHVG